MSPLFGPISQMITTRGRRTRQPILTIRYGHGDVAYQFEPEPMWNETETKVYGRTGLPEALGWIMEGTNSDNTPLQSSDMRVRGMTNLTLTAINTGKTM
ncbi:MAG: hypothetical protein ALECFALPRED_003318 [Alectoria fallacina]|uniref:Uncharacterized protein n=1 Tax=Alectoria fallacina TaxID=1903189 RepID=A0A8H3EL70_9LECA|nr:MAG: hypothetical protein ALECFALPRED_003318 [Alectoria fallacina]